MLNEKLAERRLPALMTLNDGRAVTTAKLWRERREELLDLLRREEYGYSGRRTWNGSMSSAA